MVSQDDLNMRRRVSRGEPEPRSLPQEFVEEVSQRAEETARSIHATLHNASGPFVMQLVGVLSGSFWKHQKEVLDVCELLTRDDHQWQVARAKLRKVQSEQLTEMSAIVRTALADLVEDKPAPPQGAAAEGGQG